MLKEGGFMLESIIKNFCKEISALTGYKIYFEEVRQGFKKPCFFIRVKDFKDEVFLSNRFFLSCNLELRFYCESQKEIYEMVEKIQDKVYLIDIGFGEISRKKFEFTKFDNGVDFNILFEFFYYKEFEKNIMESMILEKE